jgi:hypothetical protein
MRALFWVGLAVLIFGVASMFIKLPQPEQVAGHTLSYTVRILLFVGGLACVMVGAVAREPE